MVNILFYGNCQLEGTLKKINLSTNNCTYIECFTTNCNENEFNNIIKSSDVIITQPIDDNYRNKHFLSTKSIIENSNINCKIIILQSLHFDFYYIDLRYLWSGGNHLREPCDYHYDYLARCCKSGLDLQYYLDNYYYNENLKSLEELENNANNAINELKNRFDESVIKYSHLKDNISFVPAYEYIKENYKDKLLFYSMNHPTKYLFDFHCEKILSILNLENTIDYSLDYLPNPRSIIYKCVQKAVNFNINECTPLTKNKNCVIEIFNLYTQVYRNINLNNYDDINTL